MFQKEMLSAVLRVPTQKQGLLNSILGKSWTLLPSIPGFFVLSLSISQSSLSSTFSLLLVTFSSALFSKIKNDSYIFFQNHDTFKEYCSEKTCGCYGGYE